MSVPTFEISAPAMDARAGDVIVFAHDPAAGPFTVAGVEQIGGELHLHYSLSPSVVDRIILPLHSYVTYRGPSAHRFEFCRSI